MNQATSGQGWQKMETTDVRKGWGLWWEEESWLGVWVARPQEEEEEPELKTEKEGVGGWRGVMVTCVRVVKDSNSHKPNDNSNNRQRPLRVISA